MPADHPCGRLGSTTTSQRRDRKPMTEDILVSADGHFVEPTDLFVSRLPKHLRELAVWEEDFEIEPLGDDGYPYFRKLHTPGFEGWTYARYRHHDGSPQSRRPCSDHRGPGPGRHPGAVDASQPRAVRAVHPRPPRALDGPRPGLQRLRVGGLRSVPGPGVPDRAHPVERSRRCRGRDRARRCTRLSSDHPAGDVADPVLVASARPGCGRRPRPTDCSWPSTWRPVA